MDDRPIRRRRAARARSLLTIFAARAATEIERERTQAELAKYQEHLEELVGQRTLELEAVQEKLRRSERLASVGTLAAGIAHEINNPVGEILLSAQFSLLSSDHSENSKNILRDIIGSAKHCKEIIQNVLRFARHDRVERSLGDLGAVLQRSSERIGRLFADAGCKIDLVIAEPLPSVVLNEVAIEQAIRNLAENARQAGATRITLRASCDSESVRLIVDDDGAGIPEELKARVFDPFFTTRQGQGGTGLGLSIVHRIIQEHEGTIEFSGQEGRSSRITITLPKPASATGGASEDGQDSDRR